jgi:hypothetical protein
MVAAIDAVSDVAQRIIGKLKEGAAAGGPPLLGAPVGNGAFLSRMLERCGLAALKIAYPNLGMRALVFRCVAVSIATASVSRWLRGLPLTAIS